MGSAASTNSQDDDSRGLTGAALARSLGRACGGALVFALPLFMTMEMWQLGLYMDRLRLLVLLLFNLPLLVFLSHYSGFERTFELFDDLRDTAIAFGVGLVTSILVFAVLGLINFQTDFSELIATIALLAVPASMGALLGRSQLGANRSDGDEEDMGTYGNELLVMATGALFLGLNVAPTEEMILIAYKMTPIHGLLLVLASLLVMHGFVFAAAFKGGSELSPETPWWSAFMRFTVVGYVVALLVSIFTLWVFGRLDGLAIPEIFGVTIVLGFPSSIGAAAARLII